MSPTAILVLGFFLGMRHATDADHVVAVSTIVSQRRTVRAAAPIGILWGLGHTVTILIVGGSIIVFGIVIPPRVGLGMELSVAIMLVGLGALNLRSVLRKGRSTEPESERGHSHPHGEARSNAPRSMRPLFVGVVHGLAGSAAIALLVLSEIRDALGAIAYLLVFGFGTVVGMLFITTALAVPVTVAARRFERFHRALGVVTSFSSVVLGAVLFCEIGFAQGLFTDHPQWTPG